MAEYDVIIIGAGAAGLMCAITAGRRGRRVLLIDHASEVGAKILISGGGRCNFTNTGATPERFLSENPDFCRSALGRLTPQDFVMMVEQHGTSTRNRWGNCSAMARRVPSFACSWTSARPQGLNCGSHIAWSKSAGHTRSASKQTEDHSSQAVWCWPRAGYRSPSWVPRGSPMTWLGGLACG